MPLVGAGMTSSAPHDTSIGVVAFKVDGRSYALPIEQVVEVLRMVAVTPVPDAPAWVSGIVNLRGRQIPMIDLRPRFGAAPTVPDPSQVFVVAQARGRTAGVLADSVEHIMELSESMIERQRDIIGATAVVAGLAATDDGAVVILDLDQLLDGADPGDES